METVIDKIYETALTKIKELVDREKKEYSLGEEYINFLDALILNNDELNFLTPYELTHLSESLSKLYLVYSYSKHYKKPDSRQDKIKAKLAELGGVPEFQQPAQNVVIPGF